MSRKQENTTEVQQISYLTFAIQELEMATKYPMRKIRMPLEILVSIATINGAIRVFNATAISLAIVKNIGCKFWPKFNNFG